MSGQRKPQPKREEVKRVTLSFDIVDIDADLHKKKMLWYGEKKVGKTVNANRAKAYFLKCEPGHSHIRHRGENIPSWDHMQAVAREIITLKKQGKFPFELVCIDTIREAWKMCTEWILKKYGIMHEGDLGHGKGYGLIENAFREVVMALSKAGLGVVFIAHDDTQTLKDDHGDEYQKIVPDMPKGCKRVVSGLVDLILYFTTSLDHETKKWRRVIKTTPTKYFEAGVRYPEGWSKRLPPEIPMDWGALVGAWDAGRPDAEDIPEPEPAPLEPAPPKAVEPPNGASEPPPRRTGTRLNV